MSNPACIICDEPGGQLRIIQQKAINKLIDSSRKRRDRKFTKWVDISSASVHMRCSEMYNRESAIKSAAADYSKKCIEGKTIAKEVLHFDFTTLCLFCGKTCNESKEKVCMVKNDETKDKIIVSIKERKHSDYKILLARLNAVKDLVEVQARYHANCMSTFYVNRRSDVVGRPASQDTIDFIQHAIKYIEHNKSESQFSLNEIKKEFTGTFPDLQTIKSKLMAFYSDSQIEFLNRKTDIIILFRHKISAQVWKEWYANQEKDKDLEKKRIVKMAGNIILEDIRKTVYDKNNYTLPNFNEKNIFDNIPESLINFLDIVIKKNKDVSQGNNFKWDKRVATTAHIIMTLARPRSFLSPILLGLSSMMHKKYASKGLLDSLSYLGLCATYDETLRFEASIVHDPNNHTCEPESFIQYIFDNADHNTCTIDGKNTFHAMGGIKVVTPSSSVTSKKTIARLKKIPSSDVIGKFGFTEIKHFEKKNAKGLSTTFIQDIFCYDSTRPKISMEDFTWLYSKYSNRKAKGYSGFMEDFFSNSDYKTSKIIPLPFVNNPPSDYDTIFTVLVQAAEENKKTNKEHICFVTFDQPLYQKARYILSCIDPELDPHSLSQIKVRLGGFHMLMSFLATIGFIMDGSGLKEAFGIVYAENSAEKAFSGHAYSRSIRVHFLVQVALAIIIFESIEITEEEKVMFDALLLNLGTENFKEDMRKEEFTIIRDKFMKKIEELQKRGPTAELWILYWDMLAIVKDFIKAERSGNWDLHLKCTEKMIPYFHASAHNNYAKSAHLYLQDMLQLKHEMDEYQFALFTTDAYFTIRRSEKFWSGVWSDMTIEQVLMRSMKTQGGLTHGRGMAESVLTKFILTMIILVEVCNEMENFCNLSYSTSEHADSTESRITRDVADLEKLLEFFSRYNPFPETPNITSIFSGIVGDNSVNCHRAYEIGMKSVKSIIGQNFESVKFTRKNKVLSLKSIVSSVKVNNETIPINPLLLFQRLCVNINSKADMKKYLKYELAPFPLALFTENGFRKNVKSQLFEEFTPTEHFLTIENIVHVIDGGFLLHKVVWQKNDTTEVIIGKYLSFIRNHYAENSCIVFDGYPDSNADNENSSASSTKTAERLRRHNSASVPNFYIEPHTKITFSQEKFLSNAKNKNELIKELSKAFRFEGYTIKQAEEDADSLIINTAIEIAEKNKISNEVGVVEYKKTVVVVGQDIDLLVLLNQLHSTNATIYFFKPGTGKVNDLIYSSNSFKHENYRSIVGFLHCFTGCDTTSAFAGKGKKTTFNSLIKTPELMTLVNPFYQSNADPQVIARNGCKLISNIYKCRNAQLSLDDLRFEQYKISAEKSTFKLEKLPPSVGAATQHAYRTYFQLQTWLGNVMTATKWGWKEVIVNNSKILMPCFTEKSVIPEDLLKKISCSCETGCEGNRCGCRKHGLRCTHLCTKCQGSDNCSNIDIISADVIDYEEEENDTQQPSISMNPENESSEEVSDSEIEDSEKDESPEASEVEQEIIQLPKKPRL